MRKSLSINVHAITFLIALRLIAFLGLILFGLLVLALFFSLAGGGTSFLLQSGAVWLLLVSCLRAVVGFLGLFLGLCLGLCLAAARAA